MQTTVPIIEIGDKAYAPLPRDLAERLELKAGDGVRARVDGNQIVIEKARPELN